MKEVDPLVHSGPFWDELSLIAWHSFRCPSEVGDDADMSQACVLTNVMTAGYRLFSGRFAGLYWCNMPSSFPTHIFWIFRSMQKRWLYPQSSVIPLTLNLSSQCPRHSFESTILRVCCRLGKTANEAVKLPGLTGSSRSWSPIIWFDPLHKPFMWSICNICWIPCEIGLVFFCDSCPSLANMNCIIGQLWYAIHASLEHMKGQIWLGITLGIIQGRQCPFCWFQLHLPCGKATGNDTWLVPVGQLKASGRWANPRWFAYDLEGVVIPEMIHIQHARLF